MSEPNSGNTPAELTVIDKPDMTFERSTFKEAKAGFHFWTLSWKSLDKAVEKYGQDGVLTLLNQSLAFNLRNKASNSLPSYEDKAKQLAEWKKQLATNPVLVSPEDAEAYSPGEREKGWLSILKAAKEAKKNGNMPLAEELWKRGQALMAAEFSAANLG